ncbi:unnamed protein product [Linum trigynum]|uniref:Uncharacterized protein n=1 Tax=Linum trigynum TaxID=586398 RepID=A0AAV2F0G9_9ROSI
MVPGKAKARVFALFFLFLLISCSEGKECTNSPTQLSSHTFRYGLLSSGNDTWKSEMFAHYHEDDHLIPTDDSAWASLLPRKVLREEEEFNWAMEYRKMKKNVQSSSAGSFLKEVSLHNVRLDPGSLYGRSQQTNLEYLLMLDVDNLVWSFRKNAGFATPGTPYGGWEAADVELRGHFVGHYLSAAAMMYASTHNETLKEKMSEVVSALSKCQDKVGSGYLSAFPSEFFDRFEAVQPVWAPYYTIHKIMAGLFDQYMFANNAQALKMVTWMADYFYGRVQNVITKYTIERHFRSLNEETGGMNDILYKLYSVTGNSKHLLLAHLFDKPCFLGLLAIQADDISGFHANTHIPIVIGAQMRYELTGDTLYKEIGTYFMEIVNSSHSYATGGTSVSEFWSEPKRLAGTLQTENEESCTTYNMLKVSRHLFRWTKEVAYADYYERAITNGVLGIQRGTEPGVMIYMLPQGPGSSKGRSYHGWGTPFQSFWCCYGTGVESFSKLGDSIYFEEEGNAPGLYIIQYISSTFDWESGQFLLSQKVDPVVSWQPFLRVTLTVSPKERSGKSSTLNLRIPTWTNANGAEATLNAGSLPLPAPGNFLSVTKKWSSSDKLTLKLPMSLRTEAIKDDRSEYASIMAILYGPYLLAGYSNGDWNLKLGSSLPESITPVPSTHNSQLLTLSQESGGSTLVVTNTNESSITMEKLSIPGSDASVHSTFRLVSSNNNHKLSTTLKDLIGEKVMLEPFHLPGMVLTQNGKDEAIMVKNSVPSDGSSEFLVVSGLDGKEGSVSLESVAQKGCFVFSGVDYKPGAKVKLSCRTSSGSGGGDEFGKGASFSANRGLSQYHPLSFVAKGENRGFILAPLLSFRDESYTVYFHFRS